MQEATGKPVAKNELNWWDNPLLLILGLPAALIAAAFLWDAMSESGPPAPLSPAEQQRRIEYDAWQNQQDNSYRGQ